jgi:putative sterol carrier protein
MPTIKEIFGKMPDSFQKEAAAGMNAVYQFDITGEGGGKWYAAITNGDLSVVEGEHASPNLTVTMTAQDYIDMAAGKLNGMVAFSTGKLKIKGDMLLAMKMQTIFKQT